ncbi:DUF1376 domain-containing protein [Leisingera sp. JC11]|uniref:DUF1376 domain-containing protein n=1 Tax=Leisingera sp. JC11 TaxID=3042469 RepID=UPI0034547D67
MTGVPYIRFFGDDWLSGTQAMSLEERGALVTIVALIAATGQPPALDYPRLARRFGCTPGKAKKVIAALADLGKISIESGAIENSRALAETEFSRKKSEKQSENASARWSKKTEKPNKNNGGYDAVAVPRECQPEPEPELKEEAKASSKNKRGTRLPEDWQLPREWGEWALSQHWPEPVIRAEADKFRDYWHSVAGQKGVKLDWLATWRNWMRNSQTPKIIPGGQHAKSPRQPDRLQRVVTAAAAGTSGQDWG